MQRKKDKHIDKYTIPNEKIYDVVSEQLGLSIYSHTEEAPRTLELPRS